MSSPPRRWSHRPCICPSDLVTHFILEVSKQNGEGGFPFQAQLISPPPSAQMTWWGCSNFKTNEQKKILVHMHVHTCNSTFSQTHSLTALVHCQSWSIKGSAAWRWIPAELDLELSRPVNLEAAEVGRVPIGQTLCPVRPAWTFTVSNQRKTSALTSKDQPNEGLTGLWS